MTSFLSAASALLKGKSGPLPDFIINEKDAWFEGRTIWSLHSAIRKEDNLPCSVLVFDSQQQKQHSSFANSKKSLLPLAKNALRRLRTIRHPDVIKLLQSAETDTAVYIAVERIRPLGKVLGEMGGMNGSGGGIGSTRRGSVTSQQQRDEWIGWGLSKLTNALRFLHSDMKVTHGNIRMDSIFLEPSGEWRLGGLELVSDQNDGGFEGPPGNASLLYTMGGMVPDAIQIAPPEVKHAGWGVLRELEIHVFDSYAFGRLILETYNGSLAPSTTTNANVIPPQGRVPAQMYALVKKMLLPNAKSRLTITSFSENGTKNPGGFFVENRLVKVANGLDGFILASEEDRGQILKTIKQSSDSFPPEFLQFKVLPVLVNAMMLAGGGTTNNSGNIGTTASGSISQYGNAGNNLGTGDRTTNVSATLHASRLLPLIVQLGQPLNDEEWKRTVAPTIFQTFKSADRSVRMALLDNLEMFISRLDVKQTSDSIWPAFLTGFIDTSAAIREATVRAIVPLSDKLTERILNNDLLRQLARTQVDSEAQIRTNTTILLGNLAPKLNLSTRKKVLIPAFVRVLKDSFIPARIAGIMAFMATAESFDGVESAQQILPSLCPCLLDRDQGVREQAKSASTLFLKKIEEAAKMMEADEQDNQQDKGTYSSSALMPTVTVQSTTSAASALAQWTFARLGGGGGGGNGQERYGIVNGGIQNNLNSIEKEKNEKAQAYNANPDPFPSTLQQELQGTINSTAAAFSLDSLQLKDGNYDDPMSLGIMEDDVDESKESEKLSWTKQGDLMDVMDDQDDWTSFTTAPSIGSNPKVKQSTSNSSQSTMAATNSRETLTSARASPLTKARLGTVKRVQNPSSNGAAVVQNQSSNRHTSVPIPLNEDEEDAWDM